MYPIAESIRKIDQDSWLVGPLILRRSSGISATGAWYDQAHDASYTIVKSPHPLPKATPIPANDPIVKLVHASDDSAVWSIGTSTLCKIKQQPAGTTLEATTLAYLRKKKPRFGVPMVLYAAESEGRTYLFQSRAWGRTLAEAWPTLNEKWKRQYIDKIAKICCDMSEWSRDRIGGVDGKGIPERYLTQGDSNNFSPENLLAGCKAAGMNCSQFVFSHGNLSPRNILVESVPAIGTLGIVDWDTAGFVPKGWIRTKFRIDSGLDLLGVNDPTEWRREVQKKLGELGFEDYSNAFSSDELA
ncbi:hypothetical protein BDV18DRAFT_144643 [Aspergillus unguis]